MSLPSKEMMASIAVTRFCLGARPNEIDKARIDPQAFLIAQIQPSGADLPQGDGESTRERLHELSEFLNEEKIAKQRNEKINSALIVKMNRSTSLRNINEDFLNRAKLGSNTSFGFRERWALFWANHFSISSTKKITSSLMGPFEREAIRPHVFGSFENLLAASSTHPAMLTYLDQAPSVGPNSPSAGRRSKSQSGLNENLAREILELHTIGVDAGYTQTDVTEFARALTGFSVGRNAEEHAGQFVFHLDAHEPGTRKIRGKTYAEGGVDQGLAVLQSLAADPHTAHHLSHKLARHFVSDNPPPTLVARLERRWLDTSGDLSAVANALIESPEAWDPTPAKFKTPYEFVLSTWRLLESEPSTIEAIAPILESLGQRRFSPRSPKGWPEEAEAWASPDGLIKRMQWTQRMAAAAADRTDPNALAVQALGARLTDPVAKAVSRAETRREAFALLVMSPEFQRR